MRRHTEKAADRTSPHDHAGASALARNYFWVHVAPNRPLSAREARPVVTLWDSGLREVEVDGVPVLFRGAKRRALLIRLLVSANQPVSIDTLADGLWDGGSGEWTGSARPATSGYCASFIGPERIFNQMGSSHLDR